MKHTPLFVASSMFIILLFGCKSAAPRISQYSDESTARESFQKIATIADSIFWHATDKCLRENSDGLKQVATLEGFMDEHECEITDVKEVKEGDNKTYVATVKIHNPKFPTAWYELTYEEAGEGWQSIDGKLMSDGHEMNYFKGRFLSATDLKPYVDGATASLTNK